MAKNARRISLRHIQIDKANTVIVVAAASAAAFLVFSLVAVQSLWVQAKYNNKVIGVKQQSLQQVKANIASLETLKNSYRTFVEKPTNVIGGTSDGKGDRDGDNAKIVLDALPSIYDFPGTISGFTKVLSNGSYGQVSIAGSDDQIAQQTNNTSTIVEVPLSMSTKGSAESVQSFLQALDRSIRPINIQTVSYTGSEGGELSVSVATKTYYQPKMKFEVTSEAVQ